MTGILGMRVAPTRQRCALQMATLQIVEYLSAHVTNARNCTGFLGLTNYGVEHRSMTPQRRDQGIQLENSESQTSHLAKQGQQETSEAQKDFEMLDFRMLPPVPIRLQSQKP